MMFVRDTTWIPEGEDQDERRQRWRDLVATIGEAQGVERALSVTRRTIASYVNHGRWVADCPECRGGIAAHPDVDEGVCPDCGRVYRLTFPDAAEVNEAAGILANRRLRHRNWMPATESPAYLRAENALLSGVLD